MVRQKRLKKRIVPSVSTAPENRAAGGKRMHGFGKAAMLSVVLLSPAVAHGQASRGAQAGESVDARLQRFEDKEEIQNLLLDYGRHLDSRDFGAYSRLFAKDGEWVGGFGSVQGPANIEA